MASYSFTWNTITFSESGGVVSGALNMEGTAEGLGTIMLTLVAHNVGTPSGTLELVAVSYPEAGEQVTMTGSGDWIQVAPDRWTSTQTALVSTGDSLKGEGEFNLGARTWAGTFS